MLTDNFGQSKVPKSKHFKAIMAKYDLVGPHLSVREFHREYVSKIDPNISHKAWNNFMLRYNSEVRRQLQLRNERALKLSMDNAVTEKELEARSMRKMLAIADVTLDEIIKDPKLLGDIPIKERMDWLFKTMRQRDSRAAVIAKVQGENRKTNVYEDVMRGAQYGAMDADVIENRPKPEPKPAPKQIEKQGVTIQVPIIRQQEGKKVEFDPNQF